MPAGALIGLVLVGLVATVPIVRRSQGARRGSGGAAGAGATGAWLFGDGDHSGGDFDGGGGGD